MGHQWNSLKYPPLKYFPLVSGDSKTRGEYFNPDMEILRKWSGLKYFPPCFGRSENKGENI